MPDDIVAFLFHVASEDLQGKKCEASRDCKAAPL